MSIFKKSEPKHRFSDEEERKIETFLTAEEFAEYNGLMLGHALSGYMPSLHAARAIRNTAIARMRLVDRIESGELV